MAVQLMHPAGVHSPPQREREHLEFAHSSATAFASQKHRHHRQTRSVSPPKERRARASPDLAMTTRVPRQRSQKPLGHEEPRYENLDGNGVPIPTEVLMDQFAEIQPAYITMLSRMTDGESTPESAETSEDRPPAPLPVERNFLDDLVEKKLKGEKPCRKGETPTAAVQRKLGYEDTELGSGKPPLPRPDRSSAQSSPSTVVRSDVAAPSSDKASSPAPAPRAKPRTSAASPATTQRTPSPADVGSAVSSLTPPSAPKNKRQLQKFEGQPTEWFHGVTTRKEADDLLRGQAIGTFLVRIGERHLGYSLSVRGSSGNKHFMVTQRDEKEFQLGTNPLIHKSMHSLVDHYHHNSLNSGGDKLSQPLNYATAPPQ